jgi:hypothetical protein
MNQTAARLRSQKVYSTDPDYLERMALHEEARDARTRSKWVERAPAAENAEAGE